MPSTQELFFVSWDWLQTLTIMTKLTYDKKSYVLSFPYVFPSHLHYLFRSLSAIFIFNLLVHNFPSDLHNNTYEYDFP